MNKVTMGQEIAIVSYSGFGGGERHSFGWIVTKITPTGRFTLTKGDVSRKFNSHGKELANEFASSRSYLAFDIAERRARVNEKVLISTACASIKYAVAPLVEICHSYNDKVSLLAKIEAAEAELAKIKALLA